MADKPCETCAYYDPIMRGTREGRHGRCAEKSVYPYAEERGQVFPPGVKRAELGERARPVIVMGKETVVSCGTYRAKSGKAGAR